MVKTFTVTEEAYGRLVSKKKRRESFSDVIMNLTGKASLLDIVGIISKEEASEIRRAISEKRKSMRERMDRASGKL